MMYAAMRTVITRRLATASRTLSLAAAARIPLTPSDVQLHRFGDRPYSDAERRRILEEENIYNDLVYCLSFAGEQDDFTKNFDHLDEQILEQLAKSEGQLRYGRPVIAADSEPLPHTLEDALRPSSRAIVITEARAPFRIFDVNGAWENLCGYSFVESQGQTLGKLLNGQETDRLAATAMIARLLEGEEAGATLTNYTKSGRRFRNRVRVGPLLDDQQKITHFVGVLQEVSDGM